MKNKLFFILCVLLILVTVFIFIDKAQAQIYEDNFCEMKGGCEVYLPMVQSNCNVFIWEGDSYCVNLIDPPGE